MSEQIAQRCMVDTCVLQYALYHLAPPRTLPANIKQLALASAELLRQLRRVRISAITWAEIHRNLDPQAAKMLSELQSKLLVIPVTEDVARLSALLLSAKFGRQSVCKRCLNSLNTSPCTVCKAKLPRSSHMADALILATAELRADVDVLYTSDQGFDSFIATKQITRCALHRPPNPHGPLFERTKAVVSAEPHTQ